MGAVALLSLTGLKGEHKLLEEVFVGGLSYILADFIVYRTKQATQVTRPNPEYGNTSFPSQHASIAFVGVTLLNREFGHISPWIAVGGYGVATWVAYARIARNRHFLPDVLMGSAVGIVSTNATFWLYDALAPKLKNHLRCSPILTKDGGELALSYQF
jgi:membrane-associated phospholipid phosphatase